MKQKKTSIKACVYQMLLLFSEVVKRENELLQGKRWRGRQISPQKDAMGQ